MSAPIGGPRRPLPVDGIAPAERVRDDERRRDPEEEPRPAPKAPKQRDPAATEAPEDEVDPDKGHGIDIRA